MKEMTLTKEYLRELFEWDTPDEGKLRFIWVVSPDGAQPIGTVVNTKPLSKGKPVNGFLRIRGKLHTVESVKKIYGVQENVA